MRRVATNNNLRSNSAKTLLNKECQKVSAGNRQSKNSLFSRLALKIILTVSISVLLIQLPFISVIENKIYDSELSKVLDQQSRFTEASAIYMAELIDEGNEDNLHLVLSTIAANPIIVRAELKQSDNSMLLYVGEESTGPSYEFGINDIDDNDNLISVGTLTTYATTKFIDESRNTRILGILVLVLIVFLVVLAVSALAVQIFVGIPLKHITRAISSQSRVPTIPWNSHDEMGAVVTRLNFLHNKLNNQLTGLEQELGAKERQEAVRIRNLANASLEGILIYKDDTIIDLNEPMAQLLGRSRHTVINESISYLFEQEQQEFISQSPSSEARKLEGTSLANKNGIKLPVEIYLNQLGDHPNAERVVVVRDISERIAAEKAVWRLAHYDSLTGLPNRRYFSENLQKAVACAREQGNSLTVAYLDLDNFKFVNDSRGHTAGDELLCAVAKSLEVTLGDEAYCARLGGDEFAILLEEDKQMKPAAEVLERVFSDLLEGPYCQAWSNVFSVSIGAARLKGSEVNENELLTRADLALYKAKENGRERICFYSDQLDANLKRKRRVVEKLVHALEQNLLELYYQPQLLTDGSIITGFEALLRWNDPELGFVSPTEIIEVAEREGMVSQLGRWVMSTACREAVNWPDHIRLAVNLSPMQLADEKLPEFVADCLNSAGLPATRLEIEITETALVSDFGKAEASISTLKKMGIMVALDDFGTGYSSLSMLQDFPFDRIKIDRSFVSNMSEDSNKASIVASIVDLGARLQLDVIAEGVESESDRIKLIEFNCLECQGYLFSRPVQPIELPDLISRYVCPEKSSDIVQFNHWREAM